MTSRFNPFRSLPVLPDEKSQDGGLSPTDKSLRRRGTPTLSCVAVVISFLCFVPDTGRLRAQSADGTVTGVVADPSGASVPQAKMVFTNMGTHIVRELSSNVDGFYTAPNLVPGDYEVTVSAAGFETQIARLTLTIGAEQELNFALRLGSIEQSLQVEAPAVGIELATTTLGAVVNERTIRDLPLNGRSWTDLAVLEPGVAPIQAQP